MSDPRKELNGMVMDCVSHPKGGWSATVHFSEEVAVGTSLTPVTITKRRWCEGCTPENCAGCAYAAPVAQQRKTVTNDEQASAYMDARLWEFIDMAGMWPRAKPDPRIWAHVMVYAPVAQPQEPDPTSLLFAVEQAVKNGACPWEIEAAFDEYEAARKAAPVAQQPQKLEDIEQYRMQMAGISTAAIGYWKEGDSIHPDYDTLALRDVAKLYAKYDALYKAQQPQEIEVQCPVCNHKFHEWPNDKQPQAEPHKPLFAEAIAKHPGLKEELMAMEDPKHPLFVPQAEAVPSDVVRDAAPIPDHELVTMYDERPTSDREMIEFAREVERRHGIGVQPQHITDGSPCWCNPDVAYTDPETGASVIVHRRPQ